MTPLMQAPEHTQARLEEALRQGVALQHARLHAQAEAHYRGLLKHYPSQPSLLQLLGLALKAQGRMAEAEEQLRRALALNPEQPHVWSNLGNLLSGLGRHA